MLKTVHSEQNFIVSQNHRL